jgi:hypothetical protein
MTTGIQTLDLSLIRVSLWWFCHFVYIKKKILTSIIFLQTNPEHIMRKEIYDQAAKIDYVNVTHTYMHDEDHFLFKSLFIKDGPKIPCS